MHVVKAVERRRFGVELEGFVFNGSSQPFDLENWLKPDGKKVVEGATMITDAGKHHIELVSDPQSLMETARAFERALALLPEGCKPCWHGEDNCPHTIGWAESERYKVMLVALSRECPDGWKRVLSMNRWASLQIHWPWNPLTNPKGLTAMNILNNLSPALALRFANPYPSRRLKEAWFDWADPRRLPNPEQWFETRDDLLAYIWSIPQLITRNGGGVWETLNKPTRHFGEATPAGREAAKGLWWFVRPRPDLPGGGTFEFRPLDSLPPREALEVAGRIVSAVDHLLRNPHSFRRIPDKEWWRLIEEQDRDRADHYLSFL